MNPNFDQGNSISCSCGKHQGIGSLSPADRAARYQRMQERLKDHIRPQEAKWLEDWKRVHGAVKYTMVEIGKADGRFGGKGDAVLAPKNFNRDIEALSPVAADIKRRSWHEAAA